MLTGGMPIIRVIYGFSPSAMMIMYFAGLPHFSLKQQMMLKRLVHFVGCEDVTDYLDVLVDKDHSDAVYDALADTLIEHKDMFDSLDLCNIPAESPTYTELPFIAVQ